jgi:hypothetical protein
MRRMTTIFGSMNDVRRFVDAIQTAPHLNGSISGSFPARPNCGMIAKVRFLNDDDGVPR